MRNEKMGNVPKKYCDQKYEAKMIKGKKLLLAKEYKASINVLKIAIANADNNLKLAESFYLIGLALYGMKSFNLAIKEFSYASKLAGGTDLENKIHYHLALAKIQLGRLHENNNFIWLAKANIFARWKYIMFAIFKTPIETRKKHVKKILPYVLRGNKYPTLITS